MGFTWPSLFLKKNASDKLGLPKNNDHKIKLIYFSCILEFLRKSLNFLWELFANDDIGISVENGTRCKKIKDTRYLLMYFSMTLSPYLWRRRKRINCFF